MNYLITLGIATLAVGCSLQAYADTEQLEQINVEGKVGTSSGETAKRTFTQAKAVSVKEDLYNSTQTLDTVIRSMPGAFTQQDKSSGVLSVNIRGESGFGRANALIDGVPQTFYSAAADSKGRAGGTSQFGANIDPNFIADVELSRGSFSGKSGINSLFGAADFRTLGVNDVVKDGDRFGILLKGLTGTNATEPNYAATAAFRQPLDNGGYFGILYGYSHRKISQDYRYGGGELIRNAGEKFLEDRKKFYFRELSGLEFINGKWEDINGWYMPKVKCLRGVRCLTVEEAVAETEKSWQEDLVHQFDVKPIDPDSLRQKSHSHLAKLEYMDDLHALTLQFRSLHNYVAGRTIDTKNYQLNYGINKGDYLDLHLLLAHNVGIQKYAAGSLFAGKTVRSPLETKNNADLLDINNSFNIELPQEVRLKTTVGFNVLKNKYSKSRYPYELGLFYGMYNRGNKALLPQKSITMQPSGKQQFYSWYLDNSLDFGRFNLAYNTNFTRYKFTGEHAEYYLGSDLRDTLDKNSPLWKQLCYTPSEGVDVCENYEPLVHKSGKKNALNHSVTLSADFHPLFMPFINYSRTHRMPNIQEMFFSHLSDLGVKTDLKPERANTYQLGINGFKEGVFRDDDLLGFKIVGYRSKIKNYIHNTFGFWGDSKIYNQHNYHPDWARMVGFSKIIHYQNYAKTVTKKGLELEFSYDMGRAYINLAYAYQKTNQPTNFSDASPAATPKLNSGKLELGYGLSKITMLPRDYGRVDIGTRWFDQKLTLGTTMRYYGKSKRATINKVNIGEQNTYDNYLKKQEIRATETIERQPLIWDFYITYEPIADLTLKVELQNAFDRKYIDPLDSNNDSANQRYYTMFAEDGDGNKSVLNNWARGRTFVLSLSYKF